MFQSLIAAEWVGAECQHCEPGEQCFDENFDQTSIATGATGRNRSTATQFAGTQIIKPYYRIAIIIRSRNVPACMTIAS